jgi:hypothetical protein
MGKELQICICALVLEEGAPVKFDSVRKTLGCPALLIAVLLQLGLMKALHLMPIEVALLGRVLLSCRPSAKHRKSLLVRPPYSCGLGNRHLCRT